MNADRTTIEHGDILIIPAHPDQAEDLFELLQRERSNLKEYVPWVSETQSLADTRRFLQESDLFNRGGQKLISMIYYQEKMAGSIGLLRINRHHRSAEMGFWLSRDNEGKSIMSTAARLLIDYVFDQTTIHRLEIKIPSSNVRAQRIPHVLGFLHEGTLRQGAFQHEEFLDLELYALLRPDWH